jgi:hypothetical protein
MRGVWGGVEMGMWRGSGVRDEGWEKCLNIREIRVYLEEYRLRTHSFVVLRETGIFAFITYLHMVDIIV